MPYLVHQTVKSYFERYFLYNKSNVVVAIVDYLYVAVLYRLTVAFVNLLSDKTGTVLASPSLVNIYVPCETCEMSTAPGCDVQRLPIAT